MHDLTNLFKALVKTKKLIDRNVTNDNRNFIQENSLFKIPKTRSEFSSNAREVVTLITKLRDFLYDNKKDYMDSVGLIGIRQSKISDRDRDKIDTEAETFIKTCRGAINKLSLLVHNQIYAPQNKENNDNILFLLEHYLIDVCKMFSVQKSVRVNRLIEKKRISRLEPDTKLLKKYPDLLKFNVKSTNNNNVKDIPLIEKSISYLNKPLNEASSVEPNKRKSVIYDELKIIEDMQNDEQINLSSEEKVMLQLENERLYNEMSGMVDELRLIEGKIVEISKLQEIFTQNVLHQEKEIYRVADTVVGTTENVKGANEEIREAMKNKAGLLVWILFFLIVNTLSLLFLDWYNE